MSPSLSSRISPVAFRRIAGTTRLMKLCQIITDERNKRDTGLKGSEAGHDRNGEGKIRKSHREKTLELEFALLLLQKNFPLFVKEFHKLL